MPQLQASYCFEGIRELLKERYGDIKIEGLFKMLSFYELETNVRLADNFDNANSLFLVANNIITKGLPTRPSVFIEKVYSNIFHFTRLHVNKQVGSFRFEQNSLSDNQIQNCYKALFIVDPGLNPRSLLKKFTRSYENLGSTFEEDFVHDVLPNHINDSFNQLVEVQRSLSEIVNNNADFTKQRVDFSVEFPLKVNEKDGIVIEIDGQHHDQVSQKLLDTQRDQAVEKMGWLPTLRIKTTEFWRIQEKLIGLRRLAGSEYFKTINENYSNGFDKSALNIMLGPIAIARIQRTIIELIISNALDVKKNSWDIVVFERDVPCAFLAIEDLKQLLENLSSLKGEENILPQINLTVINTPEYSKSKVNTFSNYKTFQVPDYPENLSCDLFIDISMLQRPGFSKRLTGITYKHFAEIRSVHSIKSRRKFKTGELIQYENIVKKTESGAIWFDHKKERVLKKLLRNVFRKISFLEGQIEIINKSLKKESVIGLLPTGGGKSLTYQMSSMLQPGVTMVIEPIKSLMKDQNDGLKRNLIDSTVFVNSSIKKQEDRKKAMELLKFGEVLFCFISPERMQIQDFRIVLEEMFLKYNTYFSYCVIDEAHCVSEWGHDFRTSYLRLGNNVRNFCNPKSGLIPIFGLTATASFDVLTDVQRELSISDEDVIRYDPSDRKELYYRVIELDVGNIEATNQWNFMQSIGILKHQEIFKIINRIPVDIKNKTNQVKTIRNFNNGDNFSEIGSSKSYFFTADSKNEFPNAGLIFCPHKSAAINSGVDALVLFLERTSNEKKLPLKIGYFYGVDGDDDEVSSIVENYQNEFIQNKLNVLVATKAFGMGIDKPNIRFTIHYNFPNSIESFIQEAGRAGRDHNPAMNYILLVSKPEYDRKILENFFDNSFRGRDKEVVVLAEILREISYPFSNNLQPVEIEIEEKYGFKASLSYYTKNGQNQLYLNESYNHGFGCIDFNRGWSINTNKKHIDIPENFAKEVLNFIKDYLKKLQINTNDIGQWLQMETPLLKQKGIEDVLRGLKSGQTAELNIGFENDKLFLLHRFLVNRVPEYSMQMIRESIKYCRTADDFIKNLKKVYRKSTGKNFNISENSLPLLRSLLRDYRDDSDTSRAIYRLSIIGVIKDYEVDYVSKMYHVKVFKQSDEFYVQRLREYLLKYLSSQKSDTLISKIVNGIAKGSTTIQKCLNILTHFVYDEIVNKRKEALKSMEFAAIIGINEPERMREHIQLYFNAKFLSDFTMNGDIYNLRKDTDNAKDYNSAIVWKYIKVTFGDVDNVKHLLGSAERLLNDNRKNAALLLMKAFSLFILNISNSGDVKNQRFINEAGENFIDGLFLFSAEKDEYENIIEEFKNCLMGFNPKADKVFFEILQVINIKQFLNPLREFNNKFLRSYEARKFSRSFISN